MDECRETLGPVFIVGVPRSGTTVLVNMLGMHPLIAPVYETRFLRNLIRLCNRACWFSGTSPSRKVVGVLGERFVSWRFLKEKARYRRKAICYSEIPAPRGGIKQYYESFPFGESHCIHYSMEDLVRETDAWLSMLSLAPRSNDEIWRSAREYVDRLFAIHCSRMGKPYWINKTPGFLNHLNGLSKLYPNGVYLNMIRDGRDVAVSNLALSWGPKTVRAAARRWKSLVLQGRNTIKAKALSCAELRYEELVESPHQLLARTFSFLGLRAETQPILSSMPVFRGRCGVWREKFGAEDRKVFAKEAGDLLIELGYEKDFRWV
jgi:hypothetical protein